MGSLHLDPSSRTLWIAVAAVAAAIMALVFLVAARLILKRLGEIRDQAALSARPASAPPYAIVGEQLRWLSTALDRHPEWAPYLHGNRTPPADNRLLHDELANVCQGVMQLVATIAEQRRSAPGRAVDWSTWGAWFRSLYAGSPALRDHVAAGVDRHPDHVLAALGYIVIREPRSGATLETWAAKEFDGTEYGEDQVLSGVMFGSSPPACLGLTGYPWMRTWVVRQQGKYSGAVIAAVEPGGKDHAAQVHVRARNASPEAQEAIRAWVVDTLADSRQLHRVEFLEPDDRGRTRRLRYDVRRPATTAEPAYLARTFRRG